MAENVTSLSLLERLREPSNQAAWERFHELYAPLLRNWLVRRGVQSQDADDLQQEVIQIVLREMPSFEHNGRPGAFRCWLRGTVSNRLRSFWRKRNRQERPVSSQGSYYDMAEQLADPRSELSRAWDEEYSRVVCDRLLKMVENEFQQGTMDAFRLVALEGKKPSDVADELGMSANAIRIAQSRVLKRLRELGRGIID